MSSIALIITFSNTLIVADNKDSRLEPLVLEANVLDQKVTSVWFIYKNSEVWDQISENLDSYQFHEINFYTYDIK